MESDQGTHKRAVHSRAVEDAAGFSELAGLQWLVSDMNPLREPRTHEATDERQLMVGLRFAVDDPESEAA